MIGVEMENEVGPVIQAMLQGRIVCGPAGPKVLRFLPPLIAEKQDVDRVMEVLEHALGVR
jgi:acetylornithine/succinyldiaminopimelate/putrescine aminotransferase